MDRNNIFLFLSRLVMFCLFKTVQLLLSLSLPLLEKHAKQKQKTHLHVRHASNTPKGCYGLAHGGDIVNNNGVMNNATVIFIINNACTATIATLLQPTASNKQQAARIEGQRNARSD